jgi:single-strand DNA-binding protein
VLPTITGEFGVVFEPELKFNDSGVAWIKIRGAASDRVYNPDTKEWEQKGDTTFLDILLGGKLAENLAESVTVGDQIIVTGDLNQREWTTNEGEKRVSYQIRAKSVGVGLVGGPAKSKRMVEQSGGGAPRSAGKAAADDPWGEQSADAPF